MKNQRKGTFLPDLIVFEELSVGLDMLEEVQRFIRANFSLRSGKVRVCDPEGHINNIRTLLTERVITNVFDLEEDVIRNLVYFLDVFETRKKWLMMMRWEDQKK